MDAWEQLRWLFDTDDGGLYDIRLAGLDESGVVAAFEFIRARSAVTPDARFWHTGLERDELVADYPDAARLVVRGVAEAFHVLAPGLAFAGVTLPDLGVFVWPDEVTLDYRMGPEWGPPELTALFEFLRQLVAVAGGRVELGSGVGATVSQQFAGELKAYSARCAAEAEPSAAADRGLGSDS
ncbi:hypothetical protein J0H58_35790 [bacterium]|nr:hypothetical protein [bacterium]